MKCHLHLHGLRLWDFARYTLSLLRTAILAREKARRKAAIPIRDHQGKLPPRAAARRHMLQ